MHRRNVITLIIILIMFAFTLWAVLPIQGERLGRKGLRLGLDLVGGVYLVYQADFPQNASAADKTADMQRTLITIQRRIDKYGVTEPIIQQLGEDRIMVQLPGFTDIEAAKKLVEQTGFLEFREVELNGSGQPVYLSDYINSSQNATQIRFINNVEQGNRVFVNEKDTPVAFLGKDAQGVISFTDTDGKPIDIETLKKGPTDLLSWMPARGDIGVQLSGGYLTDAAPTLRQEVTGAEAEVNIEWNSEGAAIFDQIARRLYNPDPNNFSPVHLLGIFLDSSLISAAQVRAQKFDGKAVISGSFTANSATELANLLKSGALPIPLSKPPLYQEKVSATLGADFIQMSLLAGLVGTLLIMLFMIAYYRLPGLLSSLALVFYASMILAVFKVFQITLSLAGLGGFIVSIGMAVDANVLIFERMKEELRTGRTLGAAIEAGFHRAWSAIFDSNATTILACIILIWLASSVVASAQVMGFAITLLIGVLVSMFTAIVVTRTLLRLFVGSTLGKKTMLFTSDWRKK